MALRCARYRDYISQISDFRLPWCEPAGGDQRRFPLGSLFLRFSGWSRYSPWNKKQSPRIF